MIEQIAEQRERPNLTEIRMLHTRVVDKRLLGMIKNGTLQVIELDISSTKDNKHYIGHHWQFYKKRGFVFPPPNVSIEEVVPVIIEHGVFTKLDCKDEGAMPKVINLAQLLGPDNCMLHTFAKEFDFQTEQREPHWQYEDIALEKIVNLRTKAGYPALQVSCRGFTYNGIATFESSNVSNLFEVCTSAKENVIDIINLNLPNNQVPPDWVLEHFHNNSVLLEVYEANRKGPLPCDVFTTIEIE